MLCFLQYLYNRSLLSLSPKHYFVGMGTKFARVEHIMTNRQLILAGITTSQMVLLQQQGYYNDSSFPSRQQNSRCHYIRTNHALSSGVVCWRFSIKGSRLNLDNTIIIPITMDALYTDVNVRILQRINYDVLISAV